MAKKENPSTQTGHDDARSRGPTSLTSLSLTSEPQELKLSEGQRRTILKYAELPARLAGRLAAKGPAATSTKFTLDELDELLDHVEWSVYRAKGNEKQKVLRIVEKVSKLLGSTISPDEMPGPRLAKKADDVEGAFDTKLSEVLPPGNRRPRFDYEYDFGDRWIHQMIVEERFPPEKGVKYPICVAGQRACPAEDCGGPWAYPEFVEEISNPDHRKHGEMLEWVGGEFEPERFDRDAVNDDLRRMPRKKTYSSPQLLTELQSPTPEAKDQQP